MLIRSLSVFVALMVVGNGVILGVSAWARTSTPITRLDIDGVRKAVAVDERVWRGAAPTVEGYRNLADAGVTVVVDLRSDSERGDAAECSTSSASSSSASRSVTGSCRRRPRSSASSTSCAHDGRGVRALRCRRRPDRAPWSRPTAPPSAARTAPVLRDNLAVGPPSLEQIVYAASGGDDPWAGITLASRVLDGPRRIWHSFT